MRRHPNASRAPNRLAALVLAIAGLLALAATPALASGPAFKESVTYAGAAQPWGLAFDSTGNLFVADPEAHGHEGEVFKLNSSNALQTSFRSSEWTLPYVRSVAVNDTTGKVYVADSGSTESIWAYKLESGTYHFLQHFVPVTRNYMFDAFDNSSGPNGGKLYVSESQTTIVKYPLNGTGEVQPSSSEPGKPLLGGFGLLNEFKPSEIEEGSGGMAIDPSTGKLYIVEAETGHQKVDVESSSNVLIEQLTGAETPAGEANFFPTAVGVDPTTHDLYVIDGKENAVDIFAENGSGEYKYAGQLEKAGNTGAFPFTNPLGVAVQRAGANAGDVYVSDGSGIDVFAAAPATPEQPLTLKKEGAGSGTVVSSPAGIECTTACPEETVEFAEGEEVTLTASPAAGSAFVAWKNCDSGGVHGRQCTVHVTPGHKPVGAKFEPANTVTVKTKGTGAGSVSGVTCGNTCTEASGIILASKTVTLKAKPYAKNSEFKGWSASPVSCTLSEEGKTCSLGTLGANETVEAEFAEIARENLKVTKSGGGQGAVKSSPAGINCSYTCGTNTAYFYKGTSVTLTASVQAGKGSELGNWGGACSGSEATPCVVTMSAAKSVTAEFK